MSLEGLALGGLLLQWILSLEPMELGVLPRSIGTDPALSLDVTGSPYAVCGITSSGSNRAPFFQTAKLIAAILRATVRRAKAGRIPWATRWS